MVKIIPMLTDPAAHGGDAADSFDVVVPSIPGYGFSPPPRRRGTNAFAVARLWAELMRGLGYARFAAQGGDWGANISSALAFLFPERLVGLHLNFLPGSYQPPSIPRGKSLRRRSAPSWKSGRTGRTARAPWAHQATKPQTLAFALADSPVGLAGWIAEKFRSWSDCDGVIEKSAATSF